MLPRIVLALAALLVTAGCSTGRADPEPTPPAATPSGEPARVLSHCGIRFVDWRGRSWVADNPQPAPQPLPSADGTSAVDGYTTGTLTRTGPDLLVFAAPGLAEPVRFRPGPGPAQPCA